MISFFCQRSKVRGLLAIALWIAASGVSHAQPKELKIGFPGRNALKLEDGRRLPGLIVLEDGVFAGVAKSRGSVAMLTDSLDAEVTLIDPLCGAPVYGLAITKDSARVTAANGVTTVPGLEAVLLRQRSRSDRVSLTIDAAPYIKFYETLSEADPELADALLTKDGSIDDAAQARLNNDAFDLEERIEDGVCIGDTETKGAFTFITLFAAKSVLRVTGVDISDGVKLVLGRKNPREATPRDQNANTFDLSPAELRLSRVVDQDGVVLCTFINDRKKRERDQDGRSVYELDCSKADEESADQ